MTINPHALAIQAAMHRRSPGAMSLAPPDKCGENYKMCYACRFCASILNDRDAFLATLDISEETRKWYVNELRYDHPKETSQ